MLVLRLAVAASLIAAAAQAAVLPATPATFAAQVAVAQPGDEIVTGPGLYGDALISGKTGLKITGAGTFNTLGIVKSKAIEVTGVGIDFTPGPKTTTSSNVLRIAGSTGVLIHDLAVRGRPVPAGTPGAKDPADPAAGMNSLLVGLYAARGVTIEAGSVDVTVRNADITGFFRGVVLTDYTNVDLDGLTLHDLRTSPIGGGTGAGLRIRGSHLYNIAPFRNADDTLGDHSDFIHLWTAAGGKPMTGLRIENNLLEQRTGYNSAPINLEDRFNVGFSGEIAGNTILVGNTQGMALANFSGPVTGNVLLAPASAGLKDYPTIVLRGTSTTTAALTGNVAHDSSVKPSMALAFPDNRWLPRAKVDPAQLAQAARGALERIYGPADPKDAVIADLKAQLAAAGEQYAANQKAMRALVDAANETAASLAAEASQANARAEMLKDARDAALAKIAAGQEALR